jgi:hypothetical protein
VEQLKIKALKKVEMDLERVNGKFFGIMETINEPN